MTYVLHSVRTAMLLSAWCHPWRSHRSTGHSGPDLSHKRRRPPGRDEHVKRRVVGQRKECSDPNIELVAIETGYPPDIVNR